MLGRFKQATKAGLLALAFLITMALFQLAALDQGAPRWIVLGVPVAVCGAVAWVYTELVVRYRVRAIQAAFVKMSEGDLETELPPAPDADIAPTREAFVRMGAALRETTGKLRQVDTMRRQLFADLAHELSTPTATVIALADALALPEIEASPEKRADLIEALVGEGLRLSRLVGDVRDLAELDDPDVALERQPVDLAQLATVLARRLTLARPDAAQIVVSAPASLVAEVDEHRIEQVLVNLLVNAQRYTPRGGTIDARIAQHEAHVRLEVEDEGTGVDDALLARLGERLFRADPSRSRATGGSGLGLSIVRAIVERHGGSLRFSRAARGGLAVTIDLPLTAGDRQM